MEAIIGKQEYKAITIKNNFVALFFCIAAVLATTYLLLQYNQNAQTAQMRQHGLELVRVLSEVPYEHLVYGERNNGHLALTRYYLEDSNFAYSAVTDVEGYIKSSTEKPGLIIPYLNPPSDPSGWVGEKHFIDSRDGRAITEFHAPIFNDGALHGYVRLGYFVPPFGFEQGQVPLFAAVALPMFLLLGLFIYMMRAELLPLKKVSAQISDSLTGKSIQKMEVHADGALSDFISKFNAFAAQSQNRVADLTASNRELITSSKLLSYQRSKIQSVLQALPEGIIVFDASGVVSYMNAKAAALLDANEEGDLDKDMSWCENEDIKKLLIKVSNNPLANHTNDEIEFTPNSMQDRNYSLKAYPLFSPMEKGVTQGTLMLLRDITEEKLAKEARGEFVAHVAHEIKNPLNVLALYSESLLGEEGGSESFRIESVNVIQDEVERLSMLINNLLNVTKIEMGSLNVQRQRVKLKDLIEDVFNTISRGQKTSHLEFELDISSDLTALYVDKDLLRIAINNLMTNAVKYSDSNGRVSLVVEEEGDLVQIRVRDQGIGISKEDQKRIFEKFYRSESDDTRSRSGHGLGLSLASDIVQLHNGTIDVTSELGKGTEFTISLENNASILGKTG